MNPVFYLLTPDRQILTGLKPYNLLTWDILECIYLELLPPSPIQLRTAQFFFLILGLSLQPASISLENHGALAEIPPTTTDTHSCLQLHIPSQFPNEFGQNWESLSTSEEKKKRSQRPPPTPDQSVASYNKRQGLQLSIFYFWLNKSWLCDIPSHVSLLRLQVRIIMTAKDYGIYLKVEYLTIGNWLGSRIRPSNSCHKVMTFHHHQSGAKFKSATSGWRQCTPSPICQPSCLNSALFIIWNLVGGGQSG